MNWFIEMEHRLFRMLGRPTPDMLPPGMRLMPRSLRRRLARKYGYGRLPAVLSVEEIDVIRSGLQAELDRRAKARESL